MATTNEPDDDGWTTSRRVKVQRRAEMILKEWREKLQCTKEEEGVDNDDNVTDDDDVRYFQQMGFLRVPHFSDSSEVKQMKQEMKRMVRQHWDPTQTSLEHRFATDDQANQERGDYFLDSADRVHVFVEPAALDPATGKLQPPYSNNVNIHPGNDDQNNKIGDDDDDTMDDQLLAALNKVGHGMHVQQGTIFHDYATSTKLQHLVQHRLGWVDPVIPQSMYIFKQAHIGGAVHSHQDATFLYTTPRPTCLGLWLALDDATLENGCLWVRPQSHVEPVRRQFVRNPDYFGPDALEQRSNVPSQANVSVSKLVMTTLVESDQLIPWEGSLPDSWQPSNDCSGLFEAGFVPIECQAGDLVVFYGTLDHLSLPNQSKAPRHTFQLHLVEGPRAGVTWSKSNWLQYPDGKPFMSIAKQEPTRRDNGGRWL